MAPEMVTSHQYTEKVDVFSIGVMLFEALRGRLNVTKLAVTHDPGSLQDYADSVADGFREDIPSNWPEEVASLVRDSWHQVRHCRHYGWGALRGLPTCPLARGSGSSRLHDPWKSHSGTCCGDQHACVPGAAQGSCAHVNAHAWVQSSRLGQN